MRSLRPMIAACLPPENIARVRKASSTGSVRQPASATAKKLSRARLASCLACAGTSSQRVRTTNRASAGVTSERGSMDVPNITERRRLHDLGWILGGRPGLAMTGPEWSFRHGRLRDPGLLVRFRRLLPPVLQVEDE